MAVKCDGELKELAALFAICTPIGAFLCFVSGGEWEVGAFVILWLVLACLFLIFVGMTGRSKW